jgi:predicted RNase H-like HicB family nuclease
MREVDSFGTCQSDKGGKCMAKRTLTALLYKDGDLYVAECPEAGTASQCATIEEALANLKEATELYLEEIPDNI